MKKLIALAAALMAFAATPALAQAVAGSPLAASSGNVANAQAQAVLPAAAGVRTYIGGFQVTATGATAASVQNVTVTDGVWTLTYAFAFPAGATVAAVPLVVSFPTPIPASTPNRSITVTLPAGGSGATNASVSAEGLQQ